MNAVPDITIVLVSYNGWNWLQQTLNTLQEKWLSKTQYDVRTVLVDNASTEDILGQVRTEFPWVELIDSQENLGFSGGNNLGLRTVEAPFTLLLNTDMELTAESNFDFLISSMQKHPDVAVVSPKVLLPDGDIDWACHRGEPTLWSAATYFSKLESAFPNSTTFAQYHQSYKDLNTVHDIDACTAAAMLVRTSAMREVGLLDERFFMYAEDLDWCRRFREAGFRIMFNPKVEIIHHKNKLGIDSSQSKTASKTKDAFYDTMLQYYDKHYATAYPSWVRATINATIKLLKGVYRVK